MGISSLSQALNATPPGLALVTTSTFSAASTVSVNGCFTSAYDNYRMIIIGTHSSTIVNLGFRLRASGSDNTSSNYAQQYLDGTATGVSAARTTGATSFTAGIGSSGTWTTWDILGPNLASPTYVHMQSAITVTAPFITIYGMGHNVSSAFDGFTIYPDSGTITGSLVVYGYRKG